MGNVRFTFRYAGVAQFPRPVTTGADQLTHNLNELGAQRLHPIWLHSLRQAEAAKPIVVIVRQHGQLQFHDVGFKIGDALSQANPFLASLMKFSMWPR